MTFRIAAAFLLLSAPVAWGQVRTWVSPLGVDTNPCTREQPCRNFGAAITAVAAGGEVVAMESAGYGPVSINKSVSIVAPAGVHAAIAPSAGTAISIAAGEFDAVVLRNLYLNSHGALNGIDADFLGTLYVENCVISGFFNNGILFDPTSSSRLFVSETTIRLCNGSGLYLLGGADHSATATLDSVRLHQNVWGFYAQMARATVRKTVSAGAGNSGFAAFEGSHLAIENSVSTSNGSGFTSNGSIITLTRCASTSNAFGIFATGAAAVIFVSESTIAANGNGVSTSGTGSILSRLNNTLAQNTLDGAFTGFFGAN